MSVVPRSGKLEPQPVDADATSRSFYRLLDETFGAENWRPNDDPRYAEELGFRPIDVIAPIDRHVALYDVASAIETRMFQEFNARVLIFVIEGSEPD